MVRHGQTTVILLITGVDGLAGRCTWQMYHIWHPALPFIPDDQKGHNRGLNRGKGRCLLDIKRAATQVQAWWSATDPNLPCVYDKSRKIKNILLDFGHNYDDPLHVHTDSWAISGGLPLWVSSQAAKEWQRFSPQFSTPGSNGLIWGLLEALCRPILEDHP